MAFDPSHHVIGADVSVAQLECKDAFEGLSDTERRYAHYVGTASWEGAKICLLQCSAEAPAVFALLMKLFHAQPAAELGAAAKAAGISDDDFQAFMVYAASFLSNLGNYKSFGDQKFIPGCPKEAFDAIVGASAAAAKDAAGVNELWSAVGDVVYSLEPRVRELGFGPDKGVSSYYSHDVTKADAELVQRFMDEKRISAYNTRLFKGADGVFELRQAAATAGAGKGFTEGEVTEFEGAKIRVVTGDYGPLMARVCENLTKAREFVANDTQGAMIDAYVKSFSGGSIDDHMDASRHWVKDKGPVVESYIGFIESYRDPLRGRGEWEGFVAVVNKAMSSKFATLVEAAPSLLPKLPWGDAFEKDSFLRPDFTSLEVIAFGSSGVPAGINIPNYDVIRQNEGYKNVSLGNVLSARDVTARVSFIADDDQTAIQSTLVPSFEVQVGLHELLGHGSGKLLQQKDDGSFNFDPALVNPETGKPVATCYTGGKTYDAVFGEISSSMEECRAECVGIYLCVDPDVLEIFGHTGEDAKRIVYINWLSMARAGLLALMFYSPTTSQWGQAHMQARFGILQVMLEAGVAEIVNADEAAKASGDGAGAGAGEGKEEEAEGAGERGVHVRVHEDRIRTAGIAAVGAFLRKIQVFKATADVEAAKALYSRYTDVPDSMLPLRDLVVANRKPRPMFVQPVTSVSDDKVELKTFESSLDGITASFVARFPETDEALLDLWRTDVGAVAVPGTIK